jgi:hypothetical protein
MGVLMVVVVAVIFVWRSYEAVAIAGEGKRGSSIHKDQRT